MTPVPPTAAARNRRPGRLLRMVVLTLAASLVAGLIGAATGLTPAAASTPAEHPPTSTQPGGDLAKDGDCAIYDLGGLAGKVGDGAEEAKKKGTQCLNDPKKCLHEGAKKVEKCVKDIKCTSGAAGKAADSAGCLLLGLGCLAGKVSGEKAKKCVSEPQKCLSGAVSNLSETVNGLDELLESIGNPLAQLGSAIAEAAHNIYVSIMLGLWQAGLFVLKLVLSLGEMFLTPDLSGEGPGRVVYGIALWIAGTLLLILILVQLGVAAFKREGKSLARAAIGLGQFVLIYVGWIAYCVAILAAAGELTKALMWELLSVRTWADWDLYDEWYNPVKGNVEMVVATVLGLLGLVLWLAAIGHLLIYLARAASLLILAASGPIAAAGLVLEFTKAWFWKALRWFHAAAFTPVLMVFVMGIGIQMATGAAAGLSDSTLKTIGTALSSVMVILVSTVAPLALFKLLAFVDPGTPSGASFREGMALQGGVGGLTGGLLSGQAPGGGQAAKADSNGKSAGESSADASTGSRFGQSTQGFLSNFGSLGQAASSGLGMVNKLGAEGASLMSDETNQADVGNKNYAPDYGAQQKGSGWPPNRTGGDPSQGDQPGDTAGNQPAGGDGNDTPPPPPPAPSPPSTPQPAGGQGAGQKQQGSGQPPGGGGAKPGGSSSGGGAPGGGAGGGAAGGGAGGGAAGGIPPV